METRKEVLDFLLRKIKDKQPILIVGLDNKDIPNIQNFTTREQHKTIGHCGFGFFEGHTENGTFSFDAGGSMAHYRFDDGSYLSYSPLRVENEEVLKDLNYDFEKVEKALTA